MSRLGALVRSASFPFMIAYVLFYGVTVAGILWFVRSATLTEMEQQLRFSVEVQLADIGRRYVLDGRAETVATIQHILATAPDRDVFILLMDKQWNILAGNLDSWPLLDAGKAGAFQSFLLNPNLTEDSPRIMAMVSELPRGHRLLVGQSAEPLERVEHTIRGVLVVSVWGCIVLGLMGGWGFALWIFRRLDRINQTCAQIMGGDLRRRVPIGRRHGDEFDQLGRHINDMLDRMNELITGIRDMSSNVAHDLRTPLNRIRNRLERMQGKGIPSAAAKHLRFAIKDVDALVATFNAILRISHAETGASRNAFASFDLRAMMLDVMELYEALAEAKDQALVMDLPPDPCFYLGDQALLAQAFANVLDNAIKYAPRSTKITVSITAEGEGYLLVVADWGEGVPEAFYDKLTQKFFRLDSSRHTSGNGLGLSLVRAAVELHGGSIRFVDHQPGLKVEMHLP